MKNFNSVIRELQLEVDDLKQIIDDRKKVLNYITTVRKEMETLHKTQLDKAVELNRSKIANLKNSLF